MPDTHFQKRCCLSFGHGYWNGTSIALSSKEYKYSLNHIINHLLQTTQQQTVSSSFILLTHVYSLRFFQSLSWLWFSAVPALCLWMKRLFIQSVNRNRSPVCVDAAYQLNHGTPEGVGDEGNTSD